MRWIISVGVLTILVTAAFLFTDRSSRDTQETDTRAVMIPITRTAPLGMKEYRSSQYRFSLFIPESMDIYTTDEGQGAATFSFEDGAAGQGFQIFVLPHLEDQVSAERFLMDIPSGIRRDMKDVNIDGVLGTSFYSEHVILGETAEIWFVNGGYLYEATTLKPLGAWLEEIFKTFEFID